MMIYKKVRLEVEDPFTKGIKSYNNVAVCICEGYIYAVNMNNLEDAARSHINENSPSDMYKDTEYLAKKIAKEMDELLPKCIISKEIKGFAFSDKLRWKITETAEA